VAHLESAELLDTVNSRDFDPPPDAFPQPKRITVSESEADAQLLYFVGPSTPLKLTAAFVPAFMQIVIGEDGHVLSTDIVNGLSIETDFRMSILKAVRQWKYKPFVANGVPVKVSTTKFIINIR
jgi:Gram-negative bacterial TonB protein C-terminal